MNKRRDNFYKKKKVLRTAFEGFDNEPPIRISDEYNRGDERKAIEEGLEEFEELKNDE